MAFLKQKKPRQFNLKPRYYDEHKERLNQAYERYEARMAQENGQKPEDHSAETRRENIHTAFQGSLDQAKADKSAKMRWGFIIGALLILIKIILHYVR
ncbi:MAG: hypothetical protein J6Y77_03750 [Paludibacteraceae bacterium]|nr:hypothetical protein [Paludibacteraceae bacterium]